MGESQGAPKEEVQDGQVSEHENLFKRYKFINDFIILLSFQLQTNLPNTNYSAIMQSVELYNPNYPGLHLSSFAATNSLSEDVNPLNYQLTTDDFIVLTQLDGQLLYTLDPSTTTSLFWVLHCLARYIVRAASHGLHNDPSIPFASKGYIPQAYFDRINMQRPDILTIRNHHSINPLCGYTTRENLAAWYRDFQTIGRLAVQWIQAARRQTLQLGSETGWNWEARHGVHLEYPERQLITNSDSGDDSLSDTTSEEFEGNIVEEKRIVLHPAKSAYATRYPDFDPFAGQTLVENGYVDDNNNHCQAMIFHPTKSNQGFAPIDYLNTTFTTHTGNMEE